MKHTCLAGALLLALSACGGGDTPAPPAPPIPATPLAAYIGKWATSCSFHAIDTLTITRAPGSGEALSIAYQTDYYRNADCTGPVLGTMREDPSATALYQGTVDTPIVFTEGAAAVSTRVDKLTTTLPIYNSVVTGPGVVHSVVDGFAQWCIDFPNGDGACIADAGPYSAGVTYLAGLTMQGKTMYALSANGSLYQLGKAYQRAD